MPPRRAASRDVHAHRVACRIHRSAAPPAVPPPARAAKKKMSRLSVLASPPALMFDHSRIIIRPCLRRTIASAFGKPETSSRGAWPSRRPGGSSYSPDRARSARPPCSSRSPNATETRRSTQPRMAPRRRCQASGSGSGCRPSRSPPERARPSFSSTRPHLLQGWASHLKGEWDRLVAGSCPFTWSPRGPPRCSSRPARVKASPVGSSASRGESRSAGYSCARSRLVVGEPCNGFDVPVERIETCR